MIEFEFDGIYYEHQEKSWRVGHRSRQGSRCYRYNEELGIQNYE